MPVPANASAAAPRRRAACDAPRTGFAPGGKPRRRRGAARGSARQRQPPARTTPSLATAAENARGRGESPLVRRARIGSAAGISASTSTPSAAPSPTAWSCGSSASWPCAVDLANSRALPGQNEKRLVAVELVLQQRHLQIHQRSRRGSGGATSVGRGAPAHRALARRERPREDRPGRGAALRSRSVDSSRPRHAMPRAPRRARRRTTPRTPSSTARGVVPVRRTILHGAGVEVLCISDAAAGAVLRRTFVRLGGIREDMRHRHRRRGQRG